MNKDAVLVRFCSYYPFPPIGLLYCGDALNKKQYIPHIKSYSDVHLEKESDKIIKEILEVSPLAVGVSLLSTEVGYAANFSQALKTHAPHIPVIWGGMHPTFLPRQCLDYQFVDYVVMGEGEETLSELLDSINGKMDISGVKGIGYKNDGRQYFTPERPLIENLDRYQAAYELIDMENCLRQKVRGKIMKSLAFVTARGCPGHCTFCYNLRFNKGKFRTHSAGHVLNRLRDLSGKYGIKNIAFQDDDFFGDVERGFEIANKIDVSFTVQARLDYVDEDFAFRLSKTNCSAYMVGFESGNDRILKDIIRKLHDTKQTLRATTALAKYPKVYFVASGMVGVPTETEEEAEQTIDFALKLARLHPRSQVGLGTCIPYVGVPIAKMCEKLGWKPPQSISDWSAYSRYNVEKLDLSWSPWMTPRKRKHLSMIYRYIRLVNGYANIDYYAWWKRLAFKFLADVAYLRIKYRFFWFPVELKLFSSWMKFRDSIGKIIKTNF